MATSNRIKQDSSSDSGTTFLSEKNRQVSDTAVFALFSGDSVSSNDFSGLVADTYHPEIIWIDKEEQDGNNSDLLLFENFLEPSCRFFENTWTGDNFREERILQDDYRYRVYFTRGCFNLNEMFYHAYIRKRNKGRDGTEKISRREQSIRDARKNFMSQNALLSYLYEIAQFYKDNHYFPVFLLADELVIYGREISSFLRTLESALSELNPEKSRDTYNDWTLRGNLIASVRLRTCVQGERPPLEDRFCAGIQPHEKRDRAGYRRYIQAASVAITQSNDVENTSYAPYFRMTVENYHILTRHLAADGWHGRKWTYLHLKAEIWQKSAPSQDGQSKVEWTFRVHPDLNERGKEGDTVRVVALPLFEGLSWDSIQRITTEILPLFQEFDDELSSKSNCNSKPNNAKRSVFHHLISLMKCSCDLIRRVQLQWITLLLAIYSFFLEIEAAETKETDCLFRLSGIRNNPEAFVPDKNHDLDKMAQNFGLLKDTYPALCALCGAEGAAFRNKMGKRLLDALQRELPTVRTEPSRFPAAAEACRNADSCLRRAEDIFYEVGMRDENMLSVVQKNGMTYGSEVQSNSRVSMNQYYKELNASRFAEKFSREDSIGALLMLMDEGLVSMVMGDTVETREVSVFLRAGELATFVIVRRLYRFVPALIELENRCRRLGYQVERQLIRFGKYLDEREPGQHLEARFQRLEDALKQCNQRLLDWNIDLLNHLDLPYLDGENPENSVRATQEWCGGAWEPEVLSCSSWMEYRQYEQGRQEHYLRLAREFSLM